MKIGFIMIQQLLVAGRLSASLAAFVGSRRAQQKFATTATTTRLFASSSSSASVVSVDSGVSRLATLQTLLSRRGAPGSRDCNLPNGDLVPVDLKDDIQDLNLHPHLFPIAHSQSTGSYVCALRRCYADDAEYESSSNAPWPIVESAQGARGMNLLALNSEHLMRRIAAESDFQNDSHDDDDSVVDIYNSGLGQGTMVDAALDAPYIAGSVAQLGYGCDKYVLLRVGPFPDLYECMAANHKERGDESSSLIAAEANNSKFQGFASTFAHYARLLHSLGPSRREEARDAARMCLRLPLPSIGFKDDDFVQVAVLAGVATREDSTIEALAKLQVFYEKIKSKEDADPPGMGTSKTEEQMAIDEANTLLDRMALTGEPAVEWSSVRKELADLYAKVGRNEMAEFVDPSRIGSS